MEERSIKLLQELSDAPGASGFEDAVVAIARRYGASIGRMEEDFLRNLYIYRKENTGSRPVIMLDAHSDEVGFMVHSIKPNGTIRFLPLGGWNRDSLVSTKVLVRNSLGEYIPGTIASKPVHFMSAAEKQGANAEIDNMVIDIGACSDTEAKESYHIRIGEPIVPATTFEYDADHDICFGKAFDCRIGCAAMLEALLRLEGRALPCDVVAVLSTQEELGPRSARVTTQRVKPDAAIVLEGCPADDTFTEPYAIQTALKHGPMFRHMDVSVVCAPRFQRFTLDLAAQKGIPVQEAVRKGGGNNAASIQTTLEGAPSIVAGIPVRYAHSPSCISSGFDFEATVEMVMALLENLSPEIIKAF